MNAEIKKTGPLAESLVDEMATELCSSFEVVIESDRASPKIHPDSLYEGCLIRGQVIDIRDSRILVDFGHKSEGILPFKDGNLVNDDLDIGDQISAIITEIDDNDLVFLTRQDAEKTEHKLLLLRSLQVGQRINGTLVESLKEGWVVDIGLPALLPHNQSGLNQSSVGEVVEVQISFIDFVKDSVLLTRRPLIEESRRSAKENFLTSLQIGDVVSGTVKNITDFGAFIQIASGIIGLCHASDMGSDPIQTGQQISVKVLKLDREKNRISLGIRQVTQPSWEQIVQRYSVGEKISGLVTSLTPYGVFIEIEPGVQGLVHISDISWSDHIRHPKDLLQIGDPVEVVILEIDSLKKRLSFGIKQVNPDPWDIVSQKYLPGMMVLGRVTSKAHFGTFIELEKGIEGLIHGSSENLEIGDMVEVVINKVDAKSRRVLLSF